MPGRSAFVAPRFRPLARLGGALLASVAVGLGSGAATASATTCGGADVEFGGLTQAQAESSVFCLSNAARAAVGQSALRPDARLQLAARRHAQDMSDRNYFEHVAPPPAPFGSDVSARTDAVGYPFRFLGENLAEGAATPRVIVDAWLHSQEHCDALLDPGYAELGVGRAASEGLWVQVLANQKDPGSTSPFAGCGRDAPPSIADVVAGPPDDVQDPAPIAIPKASGVRIGSVRASDGRWVVRVTGGRAIGRTATVAIYASQRRCVSQTGKATRCTTEPGRRLTGASTRVRASTTVRVRRAAGGAFVRVTLAAFTQGGVRYAKTTVTRKLPR